MAPARTVRRRRGRLPDRRRLLGVVLLRDVAGRGPRPDVHRVRGAGRRGARARSRSSAATPALRAGTRSSRPRPGSRGPWPRSRSPACCLRSARASCAAASPTLGLLIFTGTPVSRISRRSASSATRARSATRWGRRRSEPDDERLRVARSRTALDPRGARPGRRRRRVRRPAGAARRWTSSSSPRRSPSRPRPGPRRRARSRPPSGPYQLPPLDLLRTAPPSTADGRDEQDTMAALERTLQTFGVDARVTGCSPRSDRLDVRGRHRRRHQGEQGPAAVERHRLRARHARRADHRADPGQVRDRRRGAEQAPRLRDARRHPALEGREGRDAPAHGRARQGRPRPAAAGEPGDDAAHPDRGRDGRRQVEPDQLLHHVDPDAHHARRRPPGADRPEARRAQPLRRGAAPAVAR